MCALQWRSTCNVFQHPYLCCPATAQELQVGGKLLLGGLGGVGGQELQLYFM